MLMMATPIASSITISFLFCVSLFPLLCSSKNGYALDGGERKTMQSHFHTFQVNSLLPTSVCSPSIKDKRKDWTVSLKVVHKYGPCSQLRPEKASAPPTLTEILTRDQSRVNSIQSRLKQNSREKDSSSSSSSNSKAATTIPAKSGPIGSFIYIVTVGLGTPKKQLSLIFDTGSTFVWTQCKPCTVFCYKQKQPIFDPSHSTTYKNCWNNLLCK
ncbi:unnamed protein product [Camellia sinensis]